MRVALILLFLPAFFLLLFGYALSWDVRGVRISVDDRDRSPSSLVPDAAARIAGRIACEAERLVALAVTAHGHEALQVGSMFALRRGQIGRAHV